MDHVKLRGGHRHGGGVGPIELGNEPPLLVDGETTRLVDRHRVSVQWFSGTILTGLCGAALMGGAVFASLDGETNFASLPEKMEAALRSGLGIGERPSVTRKSDKLPAVSEPSVARQVIRVSTTSRAGNREVVRVRPYFRIAGNLSLSTSQLSANIPRFNPQRLLADLAPGGPAAAENQPTAAPDAEVSFVTRDLVALLPRAKIAQTLQPDDVMARVREAGRWTGSAAPTRYAAVQPQPSLVKLAYAAEGEVDPYAGFEARIVPENITLMPKTASQATGGNNWIERLVVAKKGDGIRSILAEIGANAEETAAIAGVLGARGRDGGMREGQRLRILLAGGNGTRLQPIRIVVLGDSAVEAVVALGDAGKYVPVDVASANATIEVPNAADEDEDDGTGVRLYESVWETALRNQVPRPVIEDLIRIYSYDVDFQRKVQAGDSFEVFFNSEDDNPNPGPDSKADVLYASLTVGGELKKFYRFQTPDDSVLDYYDETGKSAKRFLVRKPVAAGIMRSGFGVRRHPILGYTKMHTGVDWAAPTGTHIYSSGNGVVERVGWEGGYGKYVRLRHSNGYETAYGHMTAFAKGIEPGVRVRQGQVIGFVGSTGLSTGAHLHYEIMVNGRFVDPMRIRLPRGRTLTGPLLANFEQERDRVDGLMARPSGRLAQSESGGGSNNGRSLRR